MILVQDDPTCALIRGQAGATPNPARIPIDHVMASDGLQVLDRTVGPDIGSDHRPVTVTLTWADG